MAFPGDPERYPRRDEVIDYLRRFAKNLDAAAYERCADAPARHAE